MKIRVLAVGTKMPHWVYDGVAEYVKRLPKDFSLIFVELPAGQRTKNSDLKRIMKTEGQAILAAVKSLAQIRATYLADVASEFFTGAVDEGTKRKDIAWFSLGGNEMSDDHWRDEEKRSITVFVEADPTKGLLLMLNSSREVTTFTLPDQSWGETFRCIFDASQKVATYEPVIAAPSSKVEVAEHSVLVWLVSRTR